MHELVLHPMCRSGPIDKVAVSLVKTIDGCHVEFRLTGNVSRVEIPDRSRPERADNLWQTTCFEIFWQREGGDHYLEFNLSPSSQWACYEFASHRAGMRNAPIDSVAIACVLRRKELTLSANIVGDLPTPADVALNAIVEDDAGYQQFWALAFPEGKPDFHSETCRQLYVAGRL